MRQETIDRIRKFTDDRDWEQFHSAANLAKSIVIEDSGEVNPPDEGGCNCSSFASAGGGILLAALLLGASFFFLKKKKN